jgi:hypothetical protein
LSGDNELLLESVENFRALGEFRPDHLHGDETLQFQVANLVDGAHSAFAELLQDFVTVREHASNAKRSL